MSVVLVVFGLLTAAQAFGEETIKGQVLGGGAPIAGSTVTLWEGSAGQPKQLAQTKTNGDGRFEIRSKGAGNDTTLYLIAAGGAAKAKSGSGENPAIVFLNVLGNKPPDNVVINELTTVASAFTHARFLKGTAISGNPLGLRIAAGNLPNLVDPVTGKWGKVLLDPLNSFQTATLATLDTLGSLITASFTVADDNWRASFYKAATPTGGTTPTNALEAVAGIAREPWADSKDLFALFDQAYPQPKDGSRRAAPFIPYLALEPPDFALSLCFSGGGNYAAGRLMFDKDGNLWSGQNWMPGSQSSVIRSIGGGVLKMAPDGTPLSPPITGFIGMGLDGVGWGTAVSMDRVWASGFNGKILVMDLNGRPVGTENDFPFKEKLFGLMGVTVAENGDVWICDGPADQLLYFPGGRVKDGRIVKVAGLASPFDVIVDPQNNVWVSNSQADTLLRFPANDPTKVETFHLGISVKALALDQKGNLWVNSLASPDFPMPKMPPGASIMEQFKILAGAIMSYPKPTGTVTMFRPDGTSPAPGGYTAGGTIFEPWGLNIDGNGDVWVANTNGKSVVYMAGDDTKGHPAGVKTGDAIHVFSSGSTQQVLTDPSIDPAGNVWVANNWNSVLAATAENPPYPISTWGGGMGITVFYGVAAPVKPPRIGPVKTY
jgi:streptogramin lyase